MVPSLFLAHGSPMLAIEDTAYTAFLAGLGQKYQPRAIVIFSAHWETETVTVSSLDGRYGTIYDFGGFPDELYRIQYPAPGSPELAGTVISRLKAAGIQSAEDTQRGLDHGSWTLLYRMYPEADVPVVQVSVNPFLPPAEQFRIGEALRGLGEADILVIGSGVTVHNLRMLKWEQKTPEAWAVAFDDWLIGELDKPGRGQLFEYANEAPYAGYAVPRAEHFVPFFIALGSGREGTPAKAIHRSYDLGTLSYLCFEFE